MFCKNLALAVSGVLLFSQLAMGQTANNPTVINGTDSTGFPIYAPVGNGTNGSVPMPVSITTGGGTDNVNVTQIGGNAVATGNGTTTTGTQRVTISSDSTGQVTSNQGAAAAVSGGWPVISGEPADTTGTFTNATQATAITTPSVDGYETATITINGTYNTATATFLASDDGGTTYYTLSCARTDSAVVETGYTALTNISRAWFCPVHSFDVIRVQSSAVTSGTVNIRISISSPSTTAGAVVSISSSSTIGVEGADGSTQASTSNTFPVSEAPTAAAGNAIVPVVSQGASTLLGKASAGNLYTVYATATADSWLMVFNSTSAPTNGATTAGTASGNLQDCVKVPSGTTTSIGGLSMPERFSAGLYFALSSTACATLTLATTGIIHGMLN